MGVAGTTAKEGAETISGSIGNLKAAWTNLVAGLADPNANLEVLFGNVFGAAGTLVDAAKNTIPAINRILSSLGDNIYDWVSQITNTLLNISYEDISELVDNVGMLFQQIMQTIGTNAPLLIDKATEIISQVLSALDEWILSGGDFVYLVSQVITSIAKAAVTLLPQILKIGAGILLDLIEGFSQALPDVLPAIVDAIFAIVDVIIDNLPLFVEAGITILFRLLEGFMNALPVFIEKIPEIVTKLVDTFIKYAPYLKQAAIKLMFELVTAFWDNRGKFSDAGQKILLEGLKIFLNIASNFAQIGTQIVNGIISGIKAKWSSLRTTLSNLASNLPSAAMSVLRIHSPSEVTADKIGAPFTMGIVEGVKRTIPDAIRDIQDQLDFASQLSVPDVNVSRETINQAPVRSGEIVLMIDGHELARFLAPAMNSQLAFGRV
jgi:hypothetical protein